MFGLYKAMDRNIKVRSSLFRIIIQCFNATQNVAVFTHLLHALFRRHFVELLECHCNVYLLLFHSPQAIKPMIFFN